MTQDKTPRIGGSRKKVSELVPGDVVYETIGYSALKTTIETVPTSKPIEIVGNTFLQWTWKAVTDDGKEITYTITEGHEHYGPELHSDSRASIMHLPPEMFKSNNKPAGAQQ